MYQELQIGQQKIQDHGLIIIANQNVRRLNIPVQYSVEKIRIYESWGSVETKEFPDHQVIEETRRGYKVREKLLRPALVKIATNPAQVNE